MAAESEWFGSRARLFDYLLLVAKGKLPLPRAVWKAVPVVAEAISTGRHDPVEEIIGTIWAAPHVHGELARRAKAHVGLWVFAFIATLSQFMEQMPDPTLAQDRETARATFIRVVRRLLARVRPRDVPPLRDMPALELEAWELFFKPVDPAHPDGPRRPLTRDQVLDLAEAALDSNLDVKALAFAERLARFYEDESADLQVEHTCCAPCSGDDKRLCGKKWRGSSHGSRCPKCGNDDRGLITHSRVRADIPEPDDAFEPGSALDAFLQERGSATSDDRSASPEQYAVAGELVSRAAGDELDEAIIRLRAQGLKLGVIAARVGRTKQTIIIRVKKMVARLRKYDEDSAA
jgi:hypothetical protein